MRIRVRELEDLDLRTKNGDLGIRGSVSRDDLNSNPISQKKIENKYSRTIISKECQLFI